MPKTRKEKWQSVENACYSFEIVKWSDGNLVEAVLYYHRITIAMQRSHFRRKFSRKFVPKVPLSEEIFAKIFHYLYLVDYQSDKKWSAKRLKTDCNGGYSENISYSSTVPVTDEKLMPKHIICLPFAR